MTSEPVQELLINFEDDEIDDADLTIAKDKRTVYTDPSDPEIDSLYRKWQDGRLILQPDFQRHFVWDRKKASRLIESALLSVPLPIIYLAEEKDDKLIVIDGQQRLTSFFSFIHGKFPDDTPFKLTGMKVFKELDNQAYKDLEKKYQNKIRDFHLRVVTIRTESDPNLKFEIFERLNTGAMPLNDMELRNCIYQGPYIKLLKQLSEESDFRFLLGIKSAESRMRDVELVLRFAAFYHNTYLKYSSPMKKFLNDEMAKYRHITEADSDELREKFKNGLAITRSMFADKAFRRFVSGNEGAPFGAWETSSFNASLYDVIMGVFCDKDKNQVFRVMDILRESIIDLMTSNQDFIDSILLATSNTARVKKRFDLMRSVVEEILSQAPKQPRLFTLDFKKALFAKNPVCDICKQQIQTVDDAAVDHIHQYWKGGLTDPDNARLTHRFCNNSRPRNDGV